MNGKVYGMYTAAFAALFGVMYGLNAFIVARRIEKHRLIVITSTSAGFHAGDFAEITVNGV